MKDIRFYLEYPNNKEKRTGTRKNLGNHSGNCIAIIPYTSPQRMDGNVDSISSTFKYPNSPVGSSAVSWEYLLDLCKRISEKQARQIHPNLFTFLDE